MASGDKIFHESWYRIADQCIALRPTVITQRQIFRGQKWFIVRDPFSNQYYRLAPESYQFIARLSPNKTVETVWKETLEQFPDTAPSQGDIIELLAQLYHANLLHSDLPPDSSKLFERYKKKKQRILKANLLNIMFFRIPLFDPDKLLIRLGWLICILISPLGVVAWLGMVVVGLKIAFDNWQGLQDQSQGILAPGNLFLLYIGMAIIKTIHEFGHAFAVRRFGGEVHTMGVMFLLFSPLPYMDASAAWMFRNKWKRVLVGSAGMLFEVFVAGIAAVVWAKTGAGLINSLAYNMMFVASVSTLLFNINPLLRFDGYYIFSDLLNIPNLHQHTKQHLTYLLEKYAFKLKDTYTPATTKQEAWIFASFGVLSNIYRIFVFSSILFFIADRFLLAGIVMAAICAVAWIVVPVIKFFKYISTHPKLEKVRPRAMSLSFGSFAGLLFFLYVVPFPYNFKSAGVVKAVHYQYVVNETGGFIQNIFVHSDQQVHPGDSLYILVNPELDEQIKEAKAALVEAEAMYLRAMTKGQADLRPIGKRIEHLEQQLGRLKKDKSNLVITSKMFGTWVSDSRSELTGMYLPRGTALGQIVNNDQYQFISVVSQQDVSDLFQSGIKSSAIKIKGQAQHEIAVKSYQTIPMEQTHLPSSALGWGAGGEIAVDVRDEKGIKTAEPFYEVRALMAPNAKVLFYHGLSGKIKFKLPMKPLLQQWWLSLRKLLQKRYKL